MRGRERALLGILLAILLVWQGSALLRRFALEPMRLTRLELERVDQTISDTEDELRLLARAEGRVDDWSSRSLPSDPLNAQRLYQQWLTDLAQDAGFSEAMVFPERVMNKSDACVGVVVSIEAEATLGQLCLFLHRFYCTDLLHEIVSLNINSQTSEADPSLRVTLVAEGLSLPSTPPRKQLFPQTTLTTDLDDRHTTITVAETDEFPSTGGFLVRAGGEYLFVLDVSDGEWTVQRGSEESTPTVHPSGEIVILVAARPATNRRSMTDYRDFIARNPFAKPPPKIATKPKSRPESNAQEEVEPDIAQFTYLVGVMAEGDQREAWFYDRWNNQRVSVSTGETFSIANVKGVISTVGPDYVSFEHAGDHWRVKVGKNLASMTPLSKESDTSPAETRRRTPVQAEPDHAS